MKLKRRCYSKENREKKKDFFEVQVYLQSKLVYRLSRAHIPLNILQVRLLHRDASLRLGGEEKFREKNEKVKLIQNTRSSNVGIVRHIYSGGQMSCLSKFLSLWRIDGKTLTGCLFLTQWKVSAPVSGTEHHFFFSKPAHDYVTQIYTFWCVVCEIILHFKSDYFSGSSKYCNQCIMMGGFSQVLGTVSSSIRQNPILKTAENLIGECLWL